MQYYIVFDIETSSIGFDNLSESQQEYILRRTKTEEEKQQKKFEMSLSPLTSQIACIAMMLVEKNEENEYVIKRKQVISNNPELSDEENETLVLNDSSKCYVSNEKNLIYKFWETLSRYKNSTLISFNGRNFDAPFLMLRSALLKIRPSRNLMDGTKYKYNLHFDLIDELTFYIGSQAGPTRRYNFDFYAQAFGIKSPKSEGIDGSMVADLFNEKKHQIIAEYCLRDVVATWELFLIWDKYLRF